MQLERAKDGWVVRVPGNVVAALEVEEGTRVTLRPIPQEQDELRHELARLRERLPTFPFDHEGWNGVDVNPYYDTACPRFAWSTRPANAR